MRTALSLAVTLVCLLHARPSISQIPTAPPLGTQPDAEFQRLLVPLTVNGTAREPIVALIKGDDIWMAVADLENVGLLPGRISLTLIRIIRGSPHVRLAETSALLAYKFDPADLTLSVDLKADVMRVNTIGFSNAVDAQPASSYTSSAYVNYALAGADQGRPTLSLEATGSMRGHTLQGLFTRDSQGRSYRGAVALSINDEPTKRQLIFGDSLWTGIGLLGSVPVGGVTLQSFFGFEPGFISTPTLDVRGFAATPSTVDVLVNGTLVGQRQIPAGPFELGTILAQAGQNNVSAVVRDAFGRETTINGNSLYGSPALLRPGLFTYSVSAGRLRQERAGQGPAYGEEVVMAQASLGMANSLTVGAGVQASRDLHAVSGQLATTGDWGELSTQLAHSHSDVGEGIALSLSYRLSTPAWGLSAAFAKRQRNFAELSSPTLLTDRVLQSSELSIGRRVFAVDLGLRLTATSNALSQSTHRLSLTAARRWNARLFTALELARSAGQVADTSLFLLVSYALDASHTVSLATTRAAGQLSSTLELSQSPQQALSTGYRLSNTWATDGSQRQLAQVSRDTQFGSFQLQASNAVGPPQYSWRAAGALALIDGVAAASTPIRDAFALVRVPGVPQVPVLVEGRFAGQTDSSGVLLVPALGSYSRQRISIDTEALPLDYEVGEVERRVSPPLRGGEVVKFDIKVYRASTGRLLQPDGKPVASAVIVLGDGRRVSTGTVGDFVIEGDPPQGEASVERPGQSASLCRVRFPAFPGRSATVQRLGELRCEP